MAQQLYLDTARFGAILPQCAEMLREFATILESEGQFPMFDAFLREGSPCWPDRLTSRFPVMARWQGLASLKNRIQQLAGIEQPATVLFASASRHLARVAFQLLSQRCERVLSSDSDWPEFRDLLHEQLARSGATLHHITLYNPLFPDSSSEHRERRLAKACVAKSCDGALLTAVSDDGVVTRIDLFLTESERLSVRPFLVVDGSQQIGHVPTALGAGFNGIYFAGTHKWLRSGVPLSFAVIPHDAALADPLLPIRKAVRLSCVDDALMLQTAGIGLNTLRQTLRLEPLLAAGLAVDHYQQLDQQALLAVRRRNAEEVVDVVRNLPIPLTANHYNGIVQLEVDGTELSAKEIHDRLNEAGLVLSLCDARGLRIACPDQLFSPAQIEQLWEAFDTLRVPYAPSSVAVGESD